MPVCHLNHLLITSFLLFDNGFSFKYHHFSSDFSKIIDQHIFLKNTCYSSMLLDKLYPVYFSYKKSFNICQCSINKSCSQMKRNTISTNYNIVCIFDAVSLLFIDLITQSNLTFDNELYNVKFFKLIYKNNMFSFCKWFKLEKKIVHEVSVWLVFPCVITYLSKMLIFRIMLMDMEEMKETNVKCV